MEGYRTAVLVMGGEAMAAEKQSTQAPHRIIVREGQQVVARPQPFRTTPASQAQKPAPRPR